LGIGGSHLVEIRPPMDLPPMNNVRYAGHHRADRVADAR
jgi:hypothetical protein